MKTELLTRDEYQTKVYILLSSIGTMGLAHKAENNDDLIFLANDCLACAKEIADGIGEILINPSEPDIEFFNINHSLKMLLLSAAGLVNVGSVTRPNRRHLEAIVQQCLTIKKAIEQ